MSYRLSMESPAWNFDPVGMEKFGATFGDANSVTTQAQWETFVAGMTVDDALVAMKGILAALTVESIET